jgi:hypothetical protein
VKITETLGTIEFATVRQSVFNCRTRSSCDSRPKGMRISLSTVALETVGTIAFATVRQLIINCRKSTVARMSATVRQSRICIGTACTDRRSVAVAQRGVTQPSSTARLAVGSSPPQKLKFRDEAELKARPAQRAQRTDIPYWRVLAVRS